jgi:hypothetical protein
MIATTNNVVLVIVVLLPLSPDVFISGHTLMLGNQKAEDGRCALERQIGSKSAHRRKVIEWWRIESKFD